MVGVRTQEHDDRTTTVHITLETEGRVQFSTLMGRLESLRRHHLGDARRRLTARD